jgi:uncharacterized protein (TIGR03083 family)
MAWKQPEPIEVAHLFPELLNHLLQLLAHFTAEQWEQPTVCAGWTVKDVALHLLGGEVSILSRRRDQFSPDPPPMQSQADLVTFINELNESWVKTARHLSPRLLCDLLAFLGEQTCTYLGSLDPHAPGPPVSWAGPAAAPAWLDLAREYTERWHHQQHIRDAVCWPGLNEPRYLAPVLDTFARALPYGYRDQEAQEGMVVTLSICGESGGSWSVQRQEDAWTLWAGAPEHPDAEVLIQEDIAWRLFTKGIGRAEARAKTSITGVQTLGLRMLDIVSIIA